MLEFDRSLPMMLYRALDNVMPRFRRVFNEFGLTETQWRVLRVLWEKENIPFRELAKATLIPAPSLVGVIDRLSEQGLVRRIRSADDRRQVFIVATPAGRELETHVSPLVEETYRELQQAFDPDSWRILLLSLERLAQIEEPAPDTVAVKEITG